MTASPLTAGGAQRRVAFKLHHNLLNHLVDRQAATPEKALAELIMNSADAGATRVELTITDTGFLLVDNGRGFASEREVEEFFATFGTPQETEKTYGRYRVGRAQIFGWANTVWTSHTFRMDVNLEDDGDGFELTQLAAPVPGCRIEGTWSARARVGGGIVGAYLADVLRRALLYPPVEIVINGEVVAKAIADQEWTSVSDSAYYRLTTTGPLVLYNQGVYVCEIPHARFHVGGVVVTRKAIELTMARNEPLPYSPDWQRIARELHDAAHGLYGAGNVVGTEEFRCYALRKALAGDGDWNAECITLVPKKQVSLRSFVRTVLGSQLICIASRGQVALVENVIRDHGLRGANLHFDTIDRLRAVLSVAPTAADEEVVSAFLDALNAACIRLQLQPLSTVAIHTAATLPDPKPSGELIPPTQWRQEERWFVRQLAGAIDELSTGVGIHPARAIAMAKTSGDVLGFTDGYSYIAVCRSLVADALSGKQGAATRLVAVCVHELCHREDSRNAGHDEAFYQAFHDIAVGHARLVDRAVTLVRDAAKTARPYVLNTYPKQELDEAWWRPQESLPTRGAALAHAQRSIDGVLRSAERGEIGLSQVAECVRTAVGELADTSRLPTIGDDAIRNRPAKSLRLVGPVMQLFRSAPPDQRPQAATLTAFVSAPAMEALTVATWCGRGWPSHFDLRWHGHPIGRVNVTNRGPRWKPNKRYDECAAHVEAAFAGIGHAFPWRARDLAQDLAWCAIAKMTLAMWEGTHGEPRADGTETLRARYAHDAAGSCFVVRTPRDPLTRYSDAPSGEALRAMVRERAPDIEFLSGDQLLGEALAAFEADAARIASDSDAFDFWLKWGRDL